MGDTYVPRFWPPFFTLAGSSTIFLGYFFSSTNSKAIFWGTKTTNFYKNRSFWPQIQFFPRSFWVQFSAASGTPPSVFRPSTPPPGVIPLKICVTTILLLLHCVVTNILVHLFSSRVTPKLVADFASRDTSSSATKSLVFASVFMLTHWTLTKWQQLCGHYFQVHFWQKILYFHQISWKFVPWDSNDNKSIFVWLMVQWRQGALQLLWPLLLTWFNFNPCMDK